ncbi:succinylglutamate desuccinylase/aspartoacylase family protein [Minwuia sp.]|uniref:succinylglutamate desuccinylase/aspartoacylase family protein n=1 Tax=Minwuia sp. TaxID=2493630 RepID=UPI003A917B1D
MRAPFKIGGKEIPAGKRRVVDLPISMMSDHTPATLSVKVIHGRRPGPTVFVSAAIHGDEINGVEIIRRLAMSSRLKTIAGTLILVPIVNSFGFIGHSRYLPDRRDLNRSFPGAARGSLAGRLAHLFMTEVVERSQYGIDLHTAAVHRTNLPQIRIDKRDPRAEELAKAFNPPVVLNSPLREGSLRHAAGEKGVPVMVFEAGEGLRFSELSIRVGVRGVLNVLRHLKMIPAEKKSRTAPPAAFSTRSSWVRAEEGGILAIHGKLGQIVDKGALLGMVSDPFGERETDIRASRAGLIVGHAVLPVVNQGDALFHIAEVARPKAAAQAVERISEDFDADPMYDEDEIL